jgi:hypothetical protein
MTDDIGEILHLCWTGSPRNIRQRRIRYSDAKVRSSTSPRGKTVTEVQALIIITAIAPLGTLSGGTAYAIGRLSVSRGAS